MSRYDNIGRAHMPVERLPNGQFAGGFKRSVPLTEDEFWARTRRTPSGCIEWTGAKHPHGYGKLPDQRLAHRVAYAFTRGDPGRFHVLHSCDNPPCCNPEHLRLGTHLENMRDMVKRGRHFHKEQTHCKHGHEFTPENTYRPPASSPYHAYRACRACNRERLRNRARRGAS